MTLNLRNISDVIELVSRTPLSLQGGSAPRTPFPDGVLSTDSVPLGGRRSQHVTPQVVARRHAHALLFTSGA